MEALVASYGDASSDSDSDTAPPTTKRKTATDKGAKGAPLPKAETVPLPPPPLSLLTPPHSIGTLDYWQNDAPKRMRSFPHLDGNYALHVYVPVYIPQSSKKELALFLKRICSSVPGLHVVDADLALTVLCKDDRELEQVALGREFHVSLGRTVPIRVHQIDSVVSMLRQRLQSHKRYWIDFSKWEVFVNDDKTRTFLSIEVVAGGLAEITKQIQLVNEVYRLHNLPEFYKDPRPHISVAWALGDISDSLKIVLEDGRKRSSVGAAIPQRLFSCKSGGVECRIGNKAYQICKFHDDQ